MKRALFLPAMVALAASVVVVSSSAEEWQSGMKRGPVAWRSTGPLAFGPEGILFMGDTQGAAIIALATEDTQPASGAGPVKVEAINQKIAALLGTAADQILIDDLVVNPISRAIYLAVSRGRGPSAVPVLVRVRTDGRPEVVNLDQGLHARAELPDAPVDGVVGSGNRQSNPRKESITDLAFFQDRVLVAGLSNEEFSSTLRAIPFPFRTVAKGSSLEIYHGAHGRFETRSPVRTFVPFKVGDEPHLLAAYTCTPLVQIPIKDLIPGSQLKGKTIAELGNRNRPLDMIVYQKDGKEFLLLANNSRGIMKIDPSSIERMDRIEAPVAGGGTQGLPFETIGAWTGVDQLDQLDPGHAVVLRRADAGALNLESLPLP